MGGDGVVLSGQTEVTSNAPQFNTGERVGAADVPNGAEEGRAKKPKLGEWEWQESKMIVSLIETSKGEKFGRTERRSSKWKQRHIWLVGG